MMSDRNLRREKAKHATLAIQGLAITAAAYRCDWTQDTGPDEMRPDFDRICALAQDYLRWAGVPGAITHADIKQALWGESDE